MDQKQKIFERTPRARSRYTLEALGLLGRLIRLSRIEKRMTVQGVADRAGISRGLLQRIEKGDPRCEIGATFEAAAIVGVTLFESDINNLAVHSKRANDMLALLPKSVHAGTAVAHDDF
ncbi:MAG: helix-turn-helix transcriptional regulator [Pseudomonadales bacterium]